MSLKESLINNINSSLNYDNSTEQMNDGQNKDQNQNGLTL